MARRRGASRHAVPRGGASHLRLRTVALVGLSLVLFALTWVGARAWFAKAELQQAQSLVSSLKTELVSGQYSGTSAKYQAIRQHTFKARALTTDPVWALAEHVPYAGRNLALMHQLTVDIDDALQLAQPLVSLASQLTPQALAPKDGAVPLQPFVDAASDVTTAAAGFDTLDRRVSGLSTRGTLRQLQAAHQELASLVHSISTTATQAVPILQAMPGVLGSNGPRTYVVMFLNNAELRPLGGTALSFAEISVDHGAIKLVRSVPAGFHNFVRHPFPVIPVPDGFDQMYPDQLGRFITEASLRPSQLTASQIVQAEWKLQFQEDISGVITLDAGALALLVKATGSIPLASGDTLTGDNTVSLLLNQVYTRYNSGNVNEDNVKQGEVYADAVGSTFARLASGKFNPMTLFKSAGSAAAANRMAVWFADPAEQAAFADTTFGTKGLLASTPTEDAVGVYLTDQVGAKLDYYLSSKLTTGSAMCAPDNRQVHRLTLELTNGLPPSAVAKLSPSISGLDYPKWGLQKGEQKVLVWFYLPPGATLLSASVDGKPLAASNLHDTDHPVQSAMLTMLPGATSQVTVDIRAAGPGKRTLVTEVTPTVQGTKLATAPLDCASVAAR